MAKILKKEKTRKTILLQKPSGTISIGGDLDKLERKFYNGLLHNSKNLLEKDINRFLFKIPLRNLIDNLNASENDKHNRYYKKLLDKLYATSVYYNMLKKDKNIIVDGKAHLIDNLDYETNKQTKETIVVYTIPEVVRESMIDIIQGNPDGIYAKIDLMIIKGLKSKYSIILYELCKDYEKVEIPEMTIEQFKEIFGIENKKAYNFSNAFSNIKQNILTPAIKEINENKDIDFMVDYHLLKEGNAYTQIKFIVTPKPKQKQLEQYKESAQTNILINAIPTEYRTKPLETYLIKCLKDYEAKYLLHQIEYTIKHKPKDFFAYLKQAIKEDYADYYANLKKEKQDKDIKKKALEEGLRRLEEERQNEIEIAIDNEKSRIYKEYLELLENEEQKEVFKKYLEKAKELYPGLDEKSFEMGLKVECLITEDIIAKNELYQLRLEKIKAKATERAQTEFEREKEKLLRQLDEL